MSGISFYHKLYNYQDPTTAFVVRKLLEGFKRSRRNYDIGAPITEFILRQICNVLGDICYSDFESCLFTSTYLLAYFALLHVSELVFTNHIQANRPLVFNDIKLVDDDMAIIVTIRVSKTNQHGYPLSCVYRLLIIMRFVVWQLCDITSAFGQPVPTIFSLILTELL